MPQKAQLRRYKLLDLPTLKQVKSGLKIKLKVRSHKHGIGPSTPELPKMPTQKRLGK